MRSRIFVQQIIMCTNDNYNAIAKENKILDPELIYWFQDFEVLSSLILDEEKIWRNVTYMRILAWKWKLIRNAQDRFVSKIRIRVENF